MAQASFVQQGDTIDYTPVADTPVGEVVVQGDLVGVSTHEIKANQLGALAVEGVFDFAKATGAAITVGTILYWDDTLNVVSTSSTGGKKQIGKAVLAAAATDVTVRVKLSQ